MATAGRGEPDTAPFVTLAGSMATLKGVIITYPEWREQDIPPVAYPPAVFADYTANVAVLDCFFLHTYDAIRFVNAFRFLVRNVYGYPSHIGLYVDNCLDIGRVENCHFWPFGVYRFESPYRTWIREHGVAFEFARTDWQYVLNTFCFGYGIGYRFSRTANGSCNGNFVGIGADCCRRAVVVEACQPAGILITNGEFVGSWETDDSVGVEVLPGAGVGKVSLTNCAIWGPLDNGVRHRSAETNLTLNACNLVSWDEGARGSAAVRVDAGTAILQGNTFLSGGLDLEVEEGAVSVIAMANQAADGFDVANRAGEALQLVANQPSPFHWTPERLRHYTLDVGPASERDLVFVRGVMGAEDAWNWGGEGTQRWTFPEAVLRLPVPEGQDVEVLLDADFPEHALGPEAGVFAGGVQLAAFPDEPGLRVFTVLVPATVAENGQVVLRLKSRRWVPAEVNPESNDRRVMGIALRRITVRVPGSDTAPFDPLAP
jgi:hypothetical protein